MREYLKEATNPIAIAVEREDGLISVRERHPRAQVRRGQPALRRAPRQVHPVEHGRLPRVPARLRRDRREAGGRLLPRGRARLRLRLLRGRLREAARGDRLHRGDLPRRQRVRQGHRRAHGGLPHRLRCGRFRPQGLPRSSTESRCTPRRSWVPEDHRGSRVPFQRDRDRLQDGRLQDAARRRYRRVFRRHLRGQLAHGRFAVHQGSA